MSLSSMSSSKRVQTDYVAKMSMLEKVGVAPKLLMTLAHAFSSLLTGLLRSKERKPPQFYKYFMYTLIRTLTRLSSPGQLQMISPPTDDIYETISAKYSQSPKSVVLEDGTRAHWIGPSSAEKIIIGFHGGGYVVPAGAGFLEFMFQTQASLSSSSSSTPISILFLSYDLAPGRRYPRQLQQAAALLSHVLHVLQKKPQNIVLVGDSAGANLACGLVSHLLHPHPSTDTPVVPVKMEGKLAGLVLLSPWVDFKIGRGSFERNRVKDCVGKEALVQWSDSFMGSEMPYSNEDFYNQPVEATPEWWEGLPVEEVLVVAGNDEVLLDGIEKFIATLKKVKSLKGNFTAIVTMGEAHEQPYIDLGMGYKTDGEQARIMKGFLKERL